MEERRANDSHILKTLEEIKVEMARIATQVEERNLTAIEWRTQVCGKFTEMKQYCQLRQDSKMKVWLTIIVVIAAGLVGWGESHRQINVNTDRLNKLEDWQLKQVEND